MSPFIPDNILDQILDRCDIVEIISSYLPLKRAGRNYKALCPFHHEKTPSFTVNPEKGIFHCFGCGVGGNVISFIMKYERLEFPEVAKMLAKKTGVLLPERSTKGFEQSASLVNSLYRIHELTAAYFQNSLVSPSGKRARDYLIKRGIQNETASKFKLGFASDAWDGLFSYLKKKGFNKEVIEKSGLIISRPQKSGYYDRFRNRLVFPIFNQRDKIIAFAGRVFDDSMPKYMNSPETLIYNKSRTLFGLNLAKKCINEKDAAVIVEGYTDLMIPYQGGMKNIIASCGTALTPEHIRLLKRHSRNVIMVYDSDKAGQMATLRGLDLLLAEDMNVGIIQLPKGFDPDSFVRKYKIEAFQELLEKPTALFEYKLNVSKSRYSTETTEAKIKVADEMLSTISKVNNAILKSEYIKRLSEALDLKEDAIRLEAKKIKKHSGGYSIQPISFNKEESVPLSAAEKIVIGLIIEDNNLISSVKEKLNRNEFCNDYAQRIVEFIFGLHEQNKTVSYAALINSLDIDGVENLLSEIAAANSAFTDKKKNLEDCILWIKKNNLKRNLEKLRHQIKEAQNVGEHGRVTELIIEYNSLMKRCSTYGNNGLKVQGGAI
jgi:DNA primase